MIIQTVSKKLRAVVALTLTLGLFAGSAAQSAYPTKPIKLVVPYNAGGGTDILARSVAAAAGESLGQPIVVDNRAGASGMIGSEYVGKSKSDGYVLLMTAADTHSVNPHVYPKIRYDAQKDFTPIVQIGYLPYALVVNPKVGANNLNEFVALAKKNPGKYTYSSWGIGSSSQVAMEMFKQKTGTELLHVPYTGAAPAMGAVVSGETDAMFVPLSLAVPNQKAGRVKIMGLGAPKRFVDAADIPTLAEQGVPLNTAPWIGILGPANLPPEAVQQFYKAVSQAAEKPEVQAALRTGGLQIDVLNPADFKALLATDFERWGATVRQAGIKAQ